MSGGHFLVALKDTTCSEKILKIKCLLIKDIDIDEEIKVSCPREMEIMKLKLFSMNFTGHTHAFA